MSNKLIIDFLIENGGRLPKGITWHRLGELCGIAPTNLERAKKDPVWRLISIGRATQDFWRRHKKREAKKLKIGSVITPIVKRRRLFYDIETSYNIVKAWRTGYNLNISPGDIIHERAIICVSYKWEGSDKVHTIEWDKGDDSKLVAKFVPILEKADEIIGHNIDRFDTKWVTTRALAAGVLMSPKIKSIDTLKIAKRHFNFNSNKLDYIADFLGLGHKLKHRGLAMWDDIVLRNDPEAMKEMVHYCEKDVTLTEEVFNRLQVYSVPKMHYGSLKGEGKSSCPECGNNEIVLKRTTTTPTGMKKKNVQCNNCRTNFTISAKLFYKGDFTVK